jgi:hypothetical protein
MTQEFISQMLNAIAFLGRLAEGDRSHHTIKNKSN